MASVRRWKGNWQVRYRDPNGRIRSKSFQRKIDAERFGSAMETDKNRGLWQDPQLGKIKLQDWVKQWHASQSHLRPTSQVSEDIYLKQHVLPKFGAWPLVRITQPEVKAWVAALIAQGLAPASVRKAYGLLRKILAAAVDAKLLVESPCRNVPLPSIVRREMRIATPDQVAELVRCIPDRYRALVLVAAWGGLRWSELAGLKVGRVNLLKGDVSVIETLHEVRGHLVYGPPKSRSGRRTVKLPRSVVDELAQHLAKYSDPSDPEALVFSSETGGVLRKNFRSRVWIPATKAAGLENLRFHDLRHSAISFRIHVGANLKELTTFSGHASVAITLDRYGHLLPNAEQALVEKLENLMPTQEAPPIGGVANL